jgi:hypothetical protein
MTALRIEVQLYAVGTDVVLSPMGCDVPDQLLQLWHIRRKQFEQLWPALDGPNQGVQFCPVSWEYAQGGLL